MKSTQILIIGGGFAGVAAAQELEKKGIETTLVDRKNYFEVTYAVLRNITAPDKTQNRARKKYTDFLTGNFIHQGVKTLHANFALLDDGSEIRFERVIIASGSRYPHMPIAKPINSMDVEARNSELKSYYQQLQSASKVLIIGGGVVGVELAGEIAYAMPKIQVTLAHNAGSLLNGFKEKTQRKALEQLEKAGVQVIFNSKYKEKNGVYLDKQTGTKSDADVVLLAVGTLPNNDFLIEKFPQILNTHGFIKVDKNLAVIGQSGFYALGDIADVGEAKLGYLAQQQGVHLAKSIANEISGKSAKAYKRNPLMALIPTGQKTGVVQLPFAVVTWKALVNMKQKDLFINKTYKGFGTQPNPN